VLFKSIFKLFKDYKNRRKGVCDSRILNTICNNFRSINTDHWYIKGGLSRKSQSSSRYYNKYFGRRLLKDEKGVIIIEVLLVSIIMVFLTYTPIEYWVVMTYHQRASHLVDKYLATMSIQGQLTPEAKTNLEQNLNDIGLNVVSINATEELKLRQLSNLEESKLKLEITVEPKIKPLIIGRLINCNNTEGVAIVAGGEILSERVYP